LGFIKVLDREDARGVRLAARLKHPATKIPKEWRLV
jgi:hypothetical protein